MNYHTFYPSPMGEILLVSDGAALNNLRLSDTPPDGMHNPDLDVFTQTRHWLDDYFAGRNPDPSPLPLAPGGTPFQKEVWQLLRSIPYGRLTTYGEIARELAVSRGMRKMSAQAVGQAVGRNPIWIIIPCHRVLGARCQLTGYAGGLEKKIWLLQHEGHNY